MNIPNKQSVFIRRNFPNEQTVETDLCFTGNVTVKDPVNDNNPVNKAFVDSIKFELIQELIKLTPPLEKLKRIDFRISSNPPILNSYNGLGCITFLNESKIPFRIVGFSLGEGFNDVTTNDLSAYATGIKQIYIAQQESAVFDMTPIINTRRLKYPLTQECLDWINEWERTNGLKIIQINCQANCLEPVGNYYDWSCALFGFKTFNQKFLLSGTSTQFTFGYLPLSGNYPITLDFWIEDNDNFPNNAINFLSEVKGFYYGNIAGSGSTQTSNSYAYSSRRSNISVILNKKYSLFNLETDLNATGNLANKIISVNFQKNENYNHIWVSDEVKQASGSNISAIIINSGKPIKSIIYNSATDEFEFADYVSTSS